METTNRSDMAKISFYLDFIGYDGSRQPTLDVLHALHTRHTREIPFENLSPFTGLRVDLDIVALLDKFIMQKRGGYCYEHNLVFQHVLRTLGFKVQGLAARVRLHVPEQTITPHTHMLLLVEIDGEKFIADTGFGGLTLTAPIRFIMDTIQDTPHGPYRLQRADAAFSLQTKTRDGWQELYRFDLIPQYKEDYEVFNWYTSTHPSSFFISDLVAARPAQDGRHTLRNRQYSFHYLDGRTENKELDSVSEIKQVLEAEFHIDTSGVPELERRLTSTLFS